MQITRIEKVSNRNDPRLPSSFTRIIPILEKIIFVSEILNWFTHEEEHHSLKLLTQNKNEERVFSLRSNCLSKFHTTSTTTFSFGTRKERIQN